MTERTEVWAMYTIDPDTAGTFTPHSPAGWLSLTYDNYSADQYQLVIYRWLPPEPLECSAPELIASGP